MKKLIFLLAIVSFVACSDTVELNPAGHYRNTFFEFSVSNSQNVDLLDPATPNHYKEEQIILFYEVDGRMIRVYNPNMDYPRNILFFYHETEYEYRIRVFLNDSDTSEKTITLIQWDDIDTDTVEAMFRKTNSSVDVSKVWLNGLEIWDLTMGDNQYYRLIK